MVGAFSFAKLKISLTKRAPSPMNFWTNSDPIIRIKVASVS